MYTTQNLRLSFDKFYALCERQRWKLETDIDWSGIRRDLLADEEIDVLRSSALVESFTPAYGADLLALYSEDVSMSSFLTIQIYEEFKHFHALRRYLKEIGIEVDDSEVVQHRADRVDYSNRLVPILKFGVSEIFTAISYRQLARKTREPVLAHLARLISADEYRHLGWYTSYLEGYINEHGIGPDEINAALEHYQHQGLDAIGDAWIEHWNYMGAHYTGIEPYRHLRRLLRRLVGRGVNLRALAERTSARGTATTFR